MRNIYLLRHAKSSWDDPAVTDHERVLNERGRRAAVVMGEYARRVGLRPELVVCSTSVRTRETASIFLAAAGLAIVPKFTKKIYEATTGQLLEVIIEADDKFSSLLLIGHNPGSEGLTCALTGEDEVVPTATLITISADVDNWSEISPSCGGLVNLMRPKEL